MPVTSKNYLRMDLMSVKKGSSVSFLDICFCCQTKLSTFLFEYFNLLFIWCPKPFKSCLVKSELLRSCEEHEKYQKVVQKVSSATCLKGVEPRWSQGRHSWQFSYSNNQSATSLYALARKKRKKKNTATTTTEQTKTPQQPKNQTKNSTKQKKTQTTKQTNKKKKGGNRCVTGVHLSRGNCVKLI